MMGKDRENSLRLALFLDDRDEMENMTGAPSSGHEHLPVS
jgi:hypothetical protein